MHQYGLALDIGTSGLRCQAIDLDTEETVATAITQRHPIPGMNVIDHVNYAMKSREGNATGLLRKAVNQLFRALGIDLSRVVRIGVCGNTFQMSLFQGIEIRDLAFAGQSMLERLGVVPPQRDGAILVAEDVGIVGVASGCRVIIPPAVRHEIGADAIAMLLMTGVHRSKEPCLVVDYGTNAEMALICGDGRIVTGSAAAGPAMEGQEIGRGMLAAPGAISDVDITPGGWQCTVLDGNMIGRKGDLVDPLTGKTVRKGEAEAIGITGTGTVAALCCGLRQGVVTPPEIHTPDGRLHLQNGIDITSRDIEEAGKAIGAMRAGFLTLLNAAGMWTGDIKTAYMSGASGLYVDARKAQAVGMVVPGASRLVQFGNTSIEMARRMAMDKVGLDFLRGFAQSLKAEHCMFATSEVFKNLYSIEYSVWCSGMPMSMYDEMLDMFRLPRLTEPDGETVVERRSMTDLPDTDRCPVRVVESGTFLKGAVGGCALCGKCVRECPERALEIREEGDRAVAYCMSDRCAGTACRRCERICPENVLRMDGLTFQPRWQRSGPEGMTHLLSRHFK